MASASIGEYAVRVVGDTQHFEKSIDASIAATRKLVAAVKETDVAVKSASGGFKNGTFAVQQLALGVQDAASVFGTAGFSGAIRAAGNNVIQFASLLNPLAGTFAAFAITGVQLVTDYFTKMGKEVAKAREEVLHFTTIQDKVKLAGAGREAVERVGEIKTSKEAEQRIRDLQKEDRIKTGTVADIDKEIAAAQRRIGEIQRNVIEKAVALDSQTSDIRPEFKKGLEQAARNKIMRERETFLNTEGSEGGTYGAKGFRGMTKADLENIAKERASIEESTKQRMELAAGDPIRKSELKDLYQKRADLQLKESFDAEIEAFGKGGKANAAADERKRKRMVGFETDRQKLIAEYNRDVFQEEEQERRKNVSRNNFAGAASRGSAQATEAIARAQAVPNELVDIDKQALAIQQKALSELSEIRLNTKPAKVVDNMIESFD